MAYFALPEYPKLISRENLSDRKIMKFPHCGSKYDFYLANDNPSSFQFLNFWSIVMFLENGFSLSSKMGFRIGFPATRSQIFNSVDFH